ncbi:hypothetical protein PSTG_09547 [Puccinia striiformis f. sp. tritici PST-78]|uniref:DDE Tnp4 domain-containing protein n=1 Tax=Puccinia striiformis f. sp. tritici PST-78 TaxID=1165861 RepID=A0A0L0VD69_9BASI|nr:hypothetical protein PSTG_09547 [Puccinia striiformis f. sp. tritici PST-78]
MSTTEPVGFPSPHHQTRNHQVATTQTHQTPPMITLSATQKAVLALFAIFLMSELGKEDLQPYYSNGGIATHVRFLLHEARTEVFREATGLERPMFDALVKELTSKGLLEDGRYFHRVLEVLVTLYPTYVNLTPKEDVSGRLSNPKYHVFRKCLGALDGVLIPITLPMSQQPAYRNRKGFIAQNVIAVVNFDLEFLCVLAGWGGSAHDSWVITDTFNKGLMIPEGQFYLADAGYALQKGLITPFRGVWYHLKEQATCSLKPANPKELFNLCHASLRNIVEETFGCLKAKFKILTTPSEHTPRVHQKFLVLGQKYFLVFEMFLQTFGGSLGKIFSRPFPKYFLGLLCWK